MSMEKILATMFLSRELAHRMHWKTEGDGSFAQHTALGSFYDAIVDNADSLAEAYMGRYGILKDVPMLVADKKPTKDNIADILEEHLDSIEKMRYEDLEEEDTALQNLIDEAVATYLSALYKLRNLK